MENFQAGWRIYGGQIVSGTVIDPKGNAVTHRFNQDGIVNEYEDSLTGRIKEKFDTDNRVTQTTDVLGRTTKYEYDSNGNLQREIDPNNRVTEYTYDTKWSKISSFTRYDDAGNPLVSFKTYDPRNGNLLTSTDALNRVTRYTYTSQGQVETVLDPRTQKVRKYEYSAAGDLISVTDPLGNTIRLIPDAAGRTVETIDALGYSTQFIRNARNQAERITGSQGVTKFEYDPRGNLKTVTDRANRLIESNLYTERNRLSQRTDGAGKTDQYTYDENGNLKTKIDRLGQTHTFNYNSENRLIRANFSDGTTQSRTFDAVGRLANITDVNGTISYQYDNLDRVIQVATPQGTINYAYDDLSRRKSMTTPKQVVNYEYDKEDNLIKIVQGTETVRIDYFPDNNRKSITLPNGVTGNYTYDDVGRITGITYQKGATVIEQLTYNYDANGAIVKRGSSGGSAKQESSKSASYDPATGRLISLNNETFTYDEKGNLKLRTGPLGTVTYDWDTRDRLAGITGPGLTASFRYDAYNRRVEKSINGQTTSYLYDDDDIVAEIGAANSAILRTDNVDEAIARYSAEGARYYLADILGSTVQLTDAAGTSQSKYAYSPYGETQQSGVDNQSAQYTGRENDGTGLYYYRNRYYSPELSRFISEDPLGVVGGINLYGYVENDPIGYTDPWGLAPNGAKNGGGGSKNRTERGFFRTDNKTPNKSDPSTPTMNPVLDNLDNLPEIIKGETDAINDARECVIAQCFDRCGNRFEIDYYDRKQPRLWEAGAVFPPSPHDVPPGCLCVQSNFRKNYNGRVPGSNR